jgi:hypothetical protein
MMPPPLNTAIQHHIQQWHQSAAAVMHLVQTAISGVVTDRGNPCHDAYLYASIWHAALGTPHGSLPNERNDFPIPNGIRPPRHMAHAGQYRSMRLQILHPRPEPKQHYCTISINRAHLCDRDMFYHFDNPTRSPLSCDRSINFDTLGFFFLIFLPNKPKISNFFGLTNSTPLSVTRDRAQISTRHRSP